MSYSASLGPWVPSDFTSERVDAAVGAEQAKVAAVNPDQTDAMAEQREKLAATIPELVKAVGPADGAVYVVISGHANPDHVPVGDWAPDALTISLSHSTRQPAVDPDV